MKISRIEEYKGGWYVGGFLPTCYSTKEFEVAFKSHKMNEECDHHFHKIGTEINLIVKGEMIIQGKKLSTGDIFIIYPYEIADPVFLTDCDIVVIKTPSDTTDKYIIK